MDEHLRNLLILGGLLLALILSFVYLMATVAASRRQRRLGEMDVLYPLEPLSDAGPLVTGDWHPAEAEASAPAAEPFTGIAPGTVHSDDETTASASDFPLPELPDLRFAPGEATTPSARKPASPSGPAVMETQPSAPPVPVIPTPAPPTPAPPAPAPPTPAPPTLAPVLAPPAPAPPTPAPPVTAPAPPAPAPPTPAPPAATPPAATPPVPAPVTPASPAATAATGDLRIDLPPLPPDSIDLPPWLKAPMPSAPQPVHAPTAAVSPGPVTSPAPQAPRPAPPMPQGRNAPEYTPVAPVELRFSDGSAPVGVRPGTRTFEEFQRAAAVLFAEYRRANPS
ncbi:MAG TPA: hypothetical protein VGK50_02295 [Coriobacteriia bacterium]|jgi:hypothetical protein